MAVVCLALAEPLFHEEAHPSERFRGKALVLLPLVLGTCLAVLFSSVRWSWQGLGVQKLVASAALQDKLRRAWAMLCTERDSVAPLTSRDCTERDGAARLTSRDCTERDGAAPRLVDPALRAWAALSQGRDNTTLLTAERAKLPAARKRPQQKKPPAARKHPQQKKPRPQQQGDDEEAARRTSKVTTPMMANSTWADFGGQHLLPNVTKALRTTLGLEKLTVVQSTVIPAALEGKDVLCRTSAGSGKTLSYAVPLVQRLLSDADKKESVKLRAVVLTPTIERTAHVHEVISKLLSFDSGTFIVDSLSAGEDYPKIQLPTILVTNPSSLQKLLRQHQGFAGALKTTKKSLMKTLEILVVDEADLMFSFGYADDIEALQPLLPEKYQAFLLAAMGAAATPDVKLLKGLLLHDPEEIKMKGVIEKEINLRQDVDQRFLQCRDGDQLLVLYTMFQFKQLAGRMLIFVKNLDEAYKLKFFMQRFKIHFNLLNTDLPECHRRATIEKFNAGKITKLIGTEEALKQQLTGQVDPTVKRSKKHGVVDIRGVNLVVNVGVPLTDYDYSLRVRLATTSVKKGTAVTLFTEQDGLLLAQLRQAHQMKPHPLKIDSIERFRYRSEDIIRSLTMSKRIVAAERTKELMIGF
eukprot:gnl/TRDRNA2_/TRDRNA2_171129_c0_seq1.p1 gnl/TRDRNA2_/TRDRNA2_171129_c0~~gnl/TRDRNA2_/TRDRNA2_171129_c0_seq1.p1  ORF type:complete len:638 (+),score=122.23 gnl/TRDRNA2_/TRDRNA2_171129_c0_seq1:38-1951(+)